MDWTYWDWLRLDPLSVVQQLQVLYWDLGLAFGITLKYMMWKEKQNSIFMNLYVGAMPFIWLPCVTLVLCRTVEAHFANKS